MARLGTWLVCCAFIFWPALVSVQSADQSERTFVATRATRPIMLDGALDEPDWAAAPVARGFIQSDPNEGAPATFDTEVRMLYDDVAVYFGAVALDRDPARVIVTDLKKDYAVETSDAFAVVLDTFHDGRNGYQFATNPSGAKYDAQVTNEGREINADWDAIWDVKTSRVATGWIVEMRIPLRTLRFASADPQTWGVNFRRKVRRLNEDSYWSPLPRIWGLEHVGRAGTVSDLRGLRGGRNLRIKPYVLSSGSTVGAGPTSGAVRGGADLKYAPANGLVWDFTLNTDFSQVEADEQQVNLTRFSLFFPEKREFFLENSGIFGFGLPDASNLGAIGAGSVAFGGRQNGSRDLRLFFSRRIGLSSDETTALPILGGTRLTGRAGAYSIGLLNIQQRADLGVAATNYTAVRLKRNVLANSEIGAVLLDKEQIGAYNRMAGVDANFRFGFLQVNGFAAQTMSPAAKISAAGNSMAARANVNYQSRDWQLRGRFDAIGLRFNDELGFVPRRGVDNAFTYFSRTIRSKRLPSWIREARPHWLTDTFVRQQDGSLDTRQQDFHLLFLLQNGGFFEAGANTNVEVTTTPFVLNRARGATIPAGRHEYTDYVVTYAGNGADVFTPSVRYSIGPFYEGYKRSYSFGPSLHVNENLTASLNLQINDISLPGVSSVSTLATARINYNFNTRVFLNTLLQYATDTHQLSANVRFNVIHRPLSDFFFVYNEHRDERLGLRQDRSLIAKLTYTLAL